MTKYPMTKEARSPNEGTIADPLVPALPLYVLREYFTTGYFVIYVREGFVAQLIRHSFVIGYFVIRHF